MSWGTILKMAEENAGTRLSAALRNNVDNFLKKIYTSSLTLPEWFAGFLGILFVRFLLEGVSNPALFGIAPFDATTVIHYLLFFLGFAFSLMLVIRLFVKNSDEIIKLSIFGFLLTWIPPLYDIVVSRGRGERIAYIFEDPQGLLKSFLSFTSFRSFGVFAGSTAGIRVEIFFLLLSIACYVFYRTKSLVKSIFCAFLCYTAGFAWGAFPSIAKSLHDLAAPAGAARTITDFFVSSINASVIPQNFLHPAVQASYFLDAILLAQVSFALVFYLVTFFVLALWFYVSFPKKFFAVLGNSRALRALHYFLMIGVGMAIALAYTHPHIAFNWLDYVAIAAVFLSYYCAGMFAVGVNDLADTGIDKISNPGRPLIAGTLDVADIKNLNFFFLGWALVGAFLAGYYSLFMVATFAAAYYIYSAPPLRLKRIPFYATFLIAIASFSAVLAGFYLLSADKSMAAFPIAYAIVIILGFTFGANIKDIKDIEGDAGEGIYTLPVIFGARVGRRIIGALAGAALLLPVFLLNTALLVPSLVAGVAIYFFATQERYQEWPIFVVYFLYVAAAAFVLAG